MPFGLIPNTGALFKFFSKYGIGTVEEILEIIRGFTTETTGAYNPVYSGFKSKKLTAPWRNTRESNYTKERFEMGTTTPLNIFTNKHGSKKFRLGISCKQMPIHYNNNLQICIDVSAKGFTPLSIIKSCFTKEKLQKLQILGKITTHISDSLTINTNLYSRDYTPIGVKLWTKVKILSKLGVLSWLKSSDTVRISDSTYILEDVGNISDIEMLEMIGDINAIRQ